MSLVREIIVDGLRESNLIGLGEEGDPAQAQEAFRLLNRGYKRVQILEGGIFLWANEGRPLENAAGPAKSVVVGQSAYASFLERARRAP